MLGSSSLRICLAAMAPALSEAATSRLKLQDTSSVTTGPFSQTKSSDSNISVLRGPCQVISSVEFCRVSTGDRSHTDKHNRAQLEPRRPAAPGSVGLRSLQVAPPPIPSTTACEGGFPSSANQFIDNFKIMNRTQSDGNKPVEQNKVELSCSEGLLKSGTRAKSAVMVNGDNEQSSRRDAAEEVVRALCEQDVHTKCDSHFTGERNAHFSLSSVRTLNAASVKMGVCMHNSQDNSQVESTPKLDVRMDEKSKDDMRKECVKKQAYLERRVDILLRRLKRMKAKVVEAHTKEQLKCFVNFEHRSLQKVAKCIKNEVSAPEELKEHFLSNEEVKNMSTAQLVKLVKTYQPNQASDGVATHLGLASRHSVTLDLTLRNQSVQTFDKLNQRVQTSGAELDSDATASSSGGESGDDEGGVFTSHHPADLPPLLKRSDWKWAVDRASVVSRWTWLQAQVSDLEYRIRQQSQIHRQLRNSKGGVVLGDQPTAVEILRRLQGLPSKLTSASSASEIRSGGEGPPEGGEASPCNISTVMSNVDKQASRLTQSLGNCLSPSSALGSPANISSPLVNGCQDSAGVETPYRVLPHLQDRASHLFESISADATCQSARCRPLRSYRKRKILRTIGLYKNSSKAARLSDLRCGCYPPSSPCPICGGRYNNTLTIDPDTMPVRERVAILDPSFHPVLSFSDEISLAIHCEGILRSGLWQNKPPPRRSRVADYRRQKVINLVTEPVKKQGGGGSRRNRRRTNNPAAVIRFSTKIKNKYENKKGKISGRKRRTGGAMVKTARVGRKTSKIMRDVMKKNQAEEEEEDEMESLYGEQQELGRDGGSNLSQWKELRDVHQRRRRVDNSFDINNIVIPLSMAASTRVEQPQYKEIVTPKWREVSVDLADRECSLARRLEKTNGVSLPPEQHKSELAGAEVEDEDISDEKYAARHCVLEQEEKKRFRNFVQYPPVRRSRARSEFNQERPDGDSTLPEESLLSFRATISGLSASHQSSSSCTQTATVEDSMDMLQQQLLVRRRTMSFSKRERTGSVVSEDVHNSLIDVGGVEPWPRRTFPLSEEEYTLIREELPSSCEPVHHRVTRRLAEPSGKVYVGGSTELLEESSAVASPHPSTESMSSEDPNDPEWVVEANKRSKMRQEDPNDPDWVVETNKRSKMRREDINDPDWVVETNKRSKMRQEDPNDPEWLGTTDTPRKCKNKR